MAGSNRASILLIDDDDHLRLSLRDFLDHRGYDVTIAATGETGMLRLKERKPDLILLDISMPGIGGTGFLKKMVAGELPRCPVVVLSARSEAQAFFESLEVEAFLPKPCDGNVLIEQIERTLSTHPDKEHAGGGNELVVLIAENDAIVSAALKTLLEAQGVTVRTLRTGPEVLEAAPHIQPRAIVIREFLPGMNGTVLAPLLAAMPSTKGVPVIIYDDSYRLRQKHEHLARELSGVARWILSIDPEKVVSATLEVCAESTV
ncbi:MAG: response regulator [Kiritimatiellae bacterium]|nr:response regulator [Kiritimatiellia bacterium]